MDAPGLIYDAITVAPTCLAARGADWTHDMIENGHRLFSDDLNAPEGPGLDAACERVCTALDDWLPSCVVPLSQATFLADPESPTSHSPRRHCRQG
ncbi:hypothetical protein [Burkholderia sp. BCC0044]|uniref:hypothetical protein n=1 Tax=Burkholderia sp. BCC0044 TaxID=2676295 RepID=UPI001FC8E8DC|nr:hypothetical protein [Burkholderia sp. BCC0044]